MENKNDFQSSKSQGHNRLRVRRTIWGSITACCQKQGISLNEPFTRVHTDTQQLSLGPNYQKVLKETPCSPIIRRSWVTSSSELTQNCPLGKLFAKVNNFKDPGFFDDSWDGSQNDHILQV